MFKFILGKLGEFVSSRVGETFWSKVVDRTADDALNNINTMKNFDLNFKTLLQDLKALIVVASDVEEQTKNLELSGRKKRKRQVEEWLERVKSIGEEVVELETRAETDGFIARLEDGGNVAELNERVLKIVEQSRDIGELVLDICGSSGETFLTNGMVGEAFNENVEMVMGLLESREVSSIGIYGMGGVGKTTLAKHINNRLLQQSVGRVFWITVSQEFTITGLQEKIARCLGVDLSDEDEVDKRATRLHGALSMMKDSVLIFDDVWENINLLEVGCSFCAGSCRLIVTTRSIEVCRRIGCKKVIRVEKLSEVEAWKLFNETLGIETELGPQVEGIAKSMAKLCDGLPLGIITMAGSMRGEEATHRWKNALAELKDCVAGGQHETGEVDEVFRVLKCSFDRLKRNHGSESNGFNTIQQCFMHFSLYPEDYEVGRDDLVRRLISDGLLDERRGRRGQVQQGHSILDKLVNVCLLESCIHYDGPESVKMHDLVRGMALKIGDGKYKRVSIGTGSLEEIYAPDEEEWTEGLEKVSLLTSGIWRFEEGFSPNCPNLSTLLLREVTTLDFIPKSFFSQMQGLCTLDLAHTNIVVLPNTVSDMKSLKALLLEGCGKLESVPYLGKLKALRELNLSSTAIKEVPAGVDELVDLRFLSMNASGLKMLPRGLLLKLGQLEHLNIPLDIQVEIEEINNLKRLEEFSGGVKSVSDFNKFVRSRAHDSCYRIGVSKNYFGNPILKMEWPEVPINNELVLSGKNIKDEKVLAKGVAYLTISRCEGVSKWFVDDLSKRFDNPSSLNILSIWSCGGIEWILRRSDGQCSEISSLEAIYLYGLDDLKGVVGVMEREMGGIGIGIGGFASAAQPPVFSSLKILFIGNCRKMRKLGLPVSALPNLEEIDIRNCEEVEEIFEEEDEGRDSATTLPKLTKLMLTGLPRLKRISKATIISNSIYAVYIKKCPELMNKLPLGFDDPTPPPTLSMIEVEREWWESLDWDINNPNLPHLLQPFLHLLPTPP